MEHDVFISYSRKDEELVKKIRAALTQANISYWIDKEEIKRGTSYAKAISQAVYNSKILLFIWSEHSNNSENTANEISLALEFEKNIVPFKISKKLETQRYDLSLIEIGPDRCLSIRKPSYSRACRLDRPMPRTWVNSVFDNIRHFGKHSYFEYFYLLLYNFQYFKDGNP